MDNCARESKSLLKRCCHHQTPTRPAKMKTIRKKRVKRPPNLANNKPHPSSKRIIGSHSANINGRISDQERTGAWDTFLCQIEQMRSSANVKLLLNLKRLSRRCQPM